MNRASRARAFAPATVANVGCGFDVLGLAVERPGDEVVARPRSTPGVALTAVHGDGGRLPREARRNTASVAARALLDRAGVEAGVELELFKGMPLASGLGSSAASAVAAVVAVDELLGLELPRAELLAAAIEGERVACGSAHADNAAPSLYGGVVLVRPGEAVDAVPLAVPEELAVALVRPHLEVATERARSLLPSAIPLHDAVVQWGNVAGLVAGLYRGDWDLIGRSLRDVVAEPARERLVPGLARVKEAASAAGALGAGLSGSGPSVFALCRGLETARRVARAMAQAFREHAGLASDSFASLIDRKGARLL